MRQWDPSLSEGIEAIIDKCVQPAAENRYQSCADLIYDLEHPELITRGFKKKQKRKLASFLVAAILSAVMFLSGIGCSLAATQVNNNTYDQLTSVVEAQFGDSIRAVAGEMLDQFGLKDVCLRIDDRGALECVLRARIETAILRAKGEN